MDNLTIIEFVRAIRKNGHRYGAVDKNNNAYSFDCGPKASAILQQWKVPFRFYDKRHFIGYYFSSCDWKDTLIDVNKILVK